MWLKEWRGYPEAACVRRVARGERIEDTSAHERANLQRTTIAFHVRSGGLLSTPNLLHIFTSTARGLTYECLAKQHAPCSPTDDPREQRVGTANPMQQKEGGNSISRRRLLRQHASTNRQSVNCVPSALHGMSTSQFTPTTHFMPQTLSRRPWAPPSRFITTTAVHPPAHEAKQKWSDFF